MARRVINIGQAVLAKNQGLADALRADFRQAGTAVVNILSSPGSGKTELLARSLDRITAEFKTGVFVGDLATDRDAARLDGHGARVIQINTDGYCHLEANMIRAAADEMDMSGLQLLIIENVGNLVCPGSHDLGEDLRVVLLSTTEGEDKPLKYPSIFKGAHVAVVTKVDLAEVLGWDRDAALENIRAVAPQVQILETSARSGTGLDAWVDLLRELVTNKSAEAARR